MGVFFTLENECYFFHGIKFMHILFCHSCVVSVEVLFHISILQAAYGDHGSFFSHIHFASSLWEFFSCCIPS